MNERQRGSLARPELAGRSRRVLVVLAVVMVALAAIAAVNIHPAFTPVPAGGLTALVVVAEVLAYAGVVLLLLCAVFALLLRTAIDQSGVDLARARLAEAWMRGVRLASLVLLVAGPVSLAAGLLPTSGGWKTALVALISTAIPYLLLFMMSRQVHKLSRTFAAL
ncbi:hypothetical protein [Flindersiella endophytica]